MANVHNTDGKGVRWEESVRQGESVTQGKPTIQGEPNADVDMDVDMDVNADISKSKDPDIDPDTQIEFTTPKRPFIIQPEPRRYLMKKFRICEIDGLTLIYPQSKNVANDKTVVRLRAKIYARLLGKFK